MSVARQSAVLARPKLVTGHGAVGTEYQAPATRQQRDQTSYGEANRLEIGIDICVIEFEVTDHRDVRQILQKLRGLVEERTVVFIALDNEVAPLPQSVARVEIAGQPADQKTRITPPVGQHPAHQ